jgi:hypothetical protein
MSGLPQQAGIENNTTRILLISLKACACLDGKAVVRPNAGRRRAFAVIVLQAKPSVSSKGQFDATVVTLKANDVLPDALLEDGLPRHQLEA